MLSIANRAQIATKQSSVAKEFQLTRIAELTVSKHGIEDIYRILQSENIKTPRQAVIRIQQELRESWRKRATIAIEAIVAEELAGIDQLQATLWGPALAGDLPTVDRLMKVLEHRAKLLGLYAPAQVRVSGTVVTMKAYENIDLGEV